MLGTCHLPFMSWVLIFFFFIQFLVWFVFLTSSLHHCYSSLLFCVGLSWINFAIKVWLLGSACPPTCFDWHFSTGNSNLSYWLLIVKTVFQEKQSIKIQIQLLNYQYLLTSVSTWKHNPCMNCCTLGIQTLDLCNSRGGYFRDRATGRHGFQLTFSQVLTSWSNDAAFAKLGSFCSFQCNKHPKGENLQKRCVMHASIPMKPWWQCREWQQYFSLKVNVNNGKY